MKFKHIITLIFIATCFLLLSCSDEVTLLASIESGDEMGENALVPFRLEQNYPNPFNPETTIQYQVGKESHYKMEVYTEDWQKVATLIDRLLVFGHHGVVFDGRNDAGEILPSGDYFYTLSADGITQVKRMKMVK
ncbi:MAG: hypothetical protein DWQ05_20870 [Calditrichaeota bacterium]|nr:MAG: hypothetical protein DWQ05_20870 [Calditrichota bacterium]